MEKVSMSQEKSECPAVFSRTYKANEMTEISLDDLSHAEANNLIRVTRFGNNINVDFLDIKHSELVPNSLFHVRHPRDSETIRQSGLGGQFYVQTSDLTVEPDGISLYDNDTKPSIFIFRPASLSQPFTITLDPECFGGIPDEYLKAFIVKTSSPAPLQFTEASVEEIRRQRK